MSLQSILQKTFIFGSSKKYWMQNFDLSLFQKIICYDHLSRLYYSFVKWNIFFFFRKYIVTCTSTTTTTLTKTETVTITTIPSTSHKASVSFSDTDGLLPFNSYDCFIQLEVDDYLSAKSIPVHVYIVQATSNVTGIALFLFIILKMHCYKPWINRGPVKTRI